MTSVPLFPLSGAPPSAVDTRSNSQRHAVHSRVPIHRPRLRQVRSSRLPSAIEAFHARRIGRRPHRPPHRRHRRHVRVGPRHCGGARVARRHRAPRRALAGTRGAGGGGHHRVGRQGAGARVRHIVAELGVVVRAQVGHRAARRAGEQRGRDDARAEELGGRLRDQLRHEHAGHVRADRDAAARARGHRGRARRQRVVGRHVHRAAGPRRPRGRRAEEKQRDRRHHAVRAQQAPAGRPHRALGQRAPRRVLGRHAPRLGRHPRRGQEHEGLPQRVEGTVPHRGAGRRHHRVAGHRGRGEATRIGALLLRPRARAETPVRHAHFVPQRTCGTTCI